MRILITGGAGFIGAHSAVHFIKQGHQVHILDNLSREGAEENLNWIATQGNFVFHKTDLTNTNAVNDLLNQKHRYSLILHLAAQTAVTFSVKEPRHDFEVNALGTLNLLEAVRKYSPESLLIYSSTNKVYGKLAGRPLVERETRYEFLNDNQGVSEEEPLDFYSPYGCSKGCADQYVRDYHRIFALNTIVFRQSCIYGTHQYGVEDQGWLAWFSIALAQGSPITIYGDGKQVRDILYIDDLISAFELAWKYRQQVSGEVFNIGGGIHNTVSLLESLKIFETHLKQKITFETQAERPGDQKVCVMNIEKAKRLLNWSPQINPNEGIARLLSWVKTEWVPPRKDQKETWKNKKLKSAGS